MKYYTRCINDLSILNVYFYLNDFLFYKMPFVLARKDMNVNEDETLLFIAVA